MKVLTFEEHLKYKHLCGFTEEEVEKQGIDCLSCPKLGPCLESHAVEGLDRYRLAMLRGEIKD